MELKPVPGFSGYYASVEGDIYSTNGRWSKDLRKLRPSACAKRLYNYLMARPTGGLKHRSVSQHVLVALAFHGPRPFSTAEVRHLNDMKTDCRASNLAWGTRQQNSEDAARNGIQPRGSKRAFAKLNEKDVVEILYRLGRGTKQLELSKEYGVSISTISDIKTGQKWKHVKGEI